MKFELNRLTDYSDEELIRELKRVAEVLGVSLTSVSRIGTKQHSGEYVQDAMGGRRWFAGIATV